MDEFIALANSVSNRRKSRAGKSLELHLEHLFIEHGLRHFATQAITEGTQKTRFFPQGLNHDTASENLRMLAVKTTCKDRWRQILNEADTIRCICLHSRREFLWLNIGRCGVGCQIGRAIISAQKIPGGES
ncbi:type II restriction endonuclease [Klebsiella pneumoniae]|uniref:type II restriction endonuclease n=1 Tax=Klebsiella pneumoniae TaxID=573 RepID=UPI003D987B47